LKPEAFIPPNSEAAKVARSALQVVTLINQLATVIFSKFMVPNQNPNE
jgi:hypothetical protein